MTLRRHRARILPILTLGIGVAVAATAQELRAPVGAPDSDLPGQAVMSPTQDATWQPEIPVEQAQTMAPPSAAAAESVEIPPSAAIEGHQEMIEPSSATAASAAAETSATPGPGAIVPTETGASTPAAAEVDAVFFSPPVPPRSLQTLVDEHRDQLRAQRNAWRNAYRADADYNEGVERYRDAMRSLYRQRRDYDQQRHDAAMDALYPWSKAQRDWSRQRSYWRQMEQLDRREAMEAYRYAPPYAFGGPPPPW